MNKVHRGILENNYPVNEIPSILEKLTKLGTMIRRWHWNYQQRQALSELPDFLLKDMGITKTDLRHEISKPFWKN